MRNIVILYGGLLRLGCLFGGAHNKDCNILGSILGVILLILHCRGNIHYLGGGGGFSTKGRDDLGDEGNMGSYRGVMRALPLEGEPNGRERVKRKQACVLRDVEVWMIASASS